MAPRSSCAQPLPWLPVTLAIAAILSLPSASSAQFGSNKVQYRTFDFQVLETEHFDVYFYPEAREGVELAARSAERWRARLGQVFDHQLSGRQPLILYASQPHFQQTNAISGQLGEGTGGVTESLRRRIILPLAGPLAATDHVVGHELVHAYQYDITSARTAGGQGGIPGVARLPLWFVEGMAEYLSIGPVHAHTALWMRDAVRGEEPLPRIRDLARGRYFPYRWGHAFWAYVAGRWGDEMVNRLLRQAARLGRPEAALEAELGLTEEELSNEWHAALRSMAARVGPDAQPASAIGEAVTRALRVGGELNVSPALSPDGRRIAFLSERSLLSIELYIADVETGEVLERVSRTVVDPHYSSLQFINSAGAWDMTGERFAFAAITRGRAALAIYDVGARRIARELVLEGVDEAFNPTWAPDGRRVAFTGMRGGFTDLFVVDLDTGTVTGLTEDAFADIHPAWSPDGRSLAFATDRFTTRLDDLSIGPLRLGLIDVESRSVRPLQAFDVGQQINPQWSPDSQAVYFVADPDGVANAYRVAVGTGEVRQITHLPTGISGITDTSPAISVAATAGRLAFTAYENGEYQIYAIGNPDVLAGSPPRVTAETGLAAALLPPFANRRDGTLVKLLESERLGLPADVPEEARDYRARLGLDLVGTPTVTVGRDQFGAFGAGGVAFQFNDMLGDHSLSVVTQLTASFNDQTGWNDLGAAAGYTNLRRRWNWGVFGEQAPYRAGGFGSGFTTIDGQTAYVEQRVIFRQVSRSVGGVLMYPFSRAQRLELTGSYRNLSFEQDVRVTAYNANTGNVLFDERQVTSLGDPLNLSTASAALVWDTASFGPTSPLVGQRYRFEVMPSYGSITYTSVLADYRRYVMPAPFYTLAGRVLHLGRYGSGGEDPRLTPLFIGYPQLVRGYDIGSFGALECRFDPNACAQFERLIGSRIAVANAEFRFPLLRPFGVSGNMYGPIPIEVALFADAGVAWDRGDRPEFLGGERGAVSSAGVAFRVNALGFAVVQIDFARPFQRPERGWVWQFSIAPGF